MFIKIKIFNLIYVNIFIEYALQQFFAFKFYTQSNVVYPKTLV